MLSHSSAHALSARALVACLLSISLFAQQSPPPPPNPSSSPAYKIEILSAAGKVRKRKKNVLSSESVVRVTDANDVPVGGIAVMFSLTNLSGGAAAFTNGAVSTIVTTNAAGLAATGSVTAAATSSFQIAVAASVPGQALTATIPVNMAAAAAAGGAAAGGGAAGAGAAAAGAGGGAAAGAGISAGVVGAIVAAGAAAAVVAAKVATGGNDDVRPANPRVRIGGPGGVAVGPPR